MVLVAAVLGLVHQAYPLDLSELGGYSGSLPVLIALWSLDHPLEPPMHLMDLLGLQILQPLQPSDALVSDGGL